MIVSKRVPARQTKGSTSGNYHCLSLHYLLMDSTCGKDRSLYLSVSFPFFFCAVYLSVGLSICLSVYRSHYLRGCMSFKFAPTPTPASLATPFFLHVHTHTHKHYLSLSILVHTLSFSFFFLRTLFPAPCVMVQVPFTLRLSSSPTTVPVLGSRKFPPCNMHMCTYVRVCVCIYE